MAVTKSINSDFVVFRAMGGSHVRAMPGNALDEFTRGEAAQMRRGDMNGAPSILEAIRKANAVGWKCLHTVAAYYGVEGEMAFKDGESLSAGKLEAARKKLERRIATLEAPDAGRGTQVKLHYEELQTPQARGRELYVELSTERTQTFVLPLVYRYTKTVREGAPAFVPIISTCVTNEGAQDGLANIPKTFAERGRLRFEHPNLANFTQPEEFTWKQLSTATARKHRVSIFSHSRTETPHNTSVIPPQWQGPHAEERLPGQRAWLPAADTFRAINETSAADEGSSVYNSGSELAPSVTSSSAGS